MCQVYISVKKVPSCKRIMENTSICMLYEQIGMRMNSVLFVFVRETERQRVQGRESALEVELWTWVPGLRRGCNAA